MPIIPKSWQSWFTHFPPSRPPASFLRRQESTAQGRRRIMPIIPKSWQSWFTHFPPSRITTSFRSAKPRHSCEGRNPQGKGGGASCPSFPNHGNHGSPPFPLRITHVIPAKAGIHRARAAVHHAHHSQIMAIMVHPLSPLRIPHVIPAQAGTQRIRARARVAVHHAHHSQIMAIMVHPLSPFANPRHSCAGRNPQGKGGGASCPSFPNHGNHGSPTFPLRKPTSFLRRQESTGQGLGGC